MKPKTPEEAWRAYWRGLRVAIDARRQWDPEFGRTNDDARQRLKSTAKSNWEGRWLPWPKRLS